MVLRGDLRISCVVKRKINDVNYAVDQQRPTRYCADSLNLDRGK